MSKNQTKATPKESEVVEVPVKVEEQAVATTNPNTALANQGEYGEFTGLGFDNTTSADYTIPFLNLLQANSPEVEGQSPMPGAKPGMFLNSVTKKLSDGEKGLIIVPCDTQHVAIEWTPRSKGGGLVSIQSINSDMFKKAEKRADPENPNKTKLYNAAGNEMVETFYVYCLVLDDVNAEDSTEFVVLSLTSSKIKKYKEIMTQLRSVKGRPPLFSNRLKITSFVDKNKVGQFFKNVQMQPALGDIATSKIPMKGPDGKTTPLLLRAFELLQALRAGMAKANYESLARTPETEAEGTDNVF
jgi:hypothetical protein